MILYINPGGEDPLSGGTRKLFDHVEILRKHGFTAAISHTHENRNNLSDDDLIVVPEVYGDGLYNLAPWRCKRIGFAQNGYLTDRWGVSDPSHHPYEHCSNLLAVMVDSNHTKDILHKKYPAMTAEVIVTHSSGNGRRGELGPFRFGPWPRLKQIIYFKYKHEHLIGPVFNRLDLPEDWTIRCLTGLEDDQIAEAYRSAAIFAAPNFEEGLCAPTQEAMISGTYIVCWYGGGTEEYLAGRCTAVAQDDVDAFRTALVDAARDIDRNWLWYRDHCEHQSNWIQRVYSRENEIEEIVAIMDRFHGRG